MHKLKYLIVAILWLTILPHSVSAHLAGQPPFFKVNGEYSILYPVPLTSLDNFELPQDLATKTYLVNRRIEFELDANFLPATKEVIDKTTFSWDFGDNTKGTGLKNTHIYKKPGSYIMKIYAQYVTDPQPQLLQSTMIHVVPTANYQLPKAIIKINGAESKEALTDILKADFNQVVNFDATSSISNSEIVSYTWDFGDQVSDNKPNTTHQYDTSLKITFPVLRIKDANGFIADTFVELENTPPGSEDTSNDDRLSGSTQKSWFGNKLVISGVIVLLGLIFYIFYNKLKTTKPTSKTNIK